MTQSTLQRIAAILIQYLNRGDDSRVFDLICQAVCLQKGLVEVQWSGSTVLRILLHRLQVRLFAVCSSFLS